MATTTALPHRAAVKTLCGTLVQDARNASTRAHDQRNFYRTLMGELIVKDLEGSCRRIFTGNLETEESHLTKPLHDSIAQQTERMNLFAKRRFITAFIRHLESVVYEMDCGDLEHA